MPKYVFNPFTAKFDLILTSGDVDHGLTTGLLDDDHTQYALLAGRSGGQSISGGTAANDDLTLQGTTNATRTTSYVIMQPNGGNVGIGDTNPTYKLRVKETISGAGGIYVSTTSGTAQQPSFYFDDTGGSGISDFEIYLDATNAYLGPYFNKGLQFVKNAGLDKTMVITNQGRVGINDTAPAAQLQVDQTSTTAAIPTLRLQQADLSEEFIRFDTTVGTGNPINTTAEGTYYGRVRVYVEGVGAKWISLHNA